MRKKTNKFLSFMLVVVMLVSTTTSNVFANEIQTIAVDGYTFEILNDDWQNTQIAYNDGIETYVFTLNKMNMSDEAAVEISNSNSLARNSQGVNYTVEFDKEKKYSSETEDFSDLVLIEKTTGNKYSFNENTRVGWVIPLGLGLTSAAIEALLAAGSAIIIAGVACVIAEDVAQELKKQKEYRYYEAFLEDDAVYIGHRIQLDREARELARSDNRGGTVMATSFSYARGLSGGAFRGPENDGMESGYWDHIHVAKNSTDEYKAHVWFLP